MYSKRIKIFVILSSLLLAVCLLRLAQMQLLTASAVQDEIAQLKQQRGQSQQLKTIRGKILDRKDKIIAVDEPRFQLHISYRLSCFFDERVRRANLLAAANKSDPNAATAEVQEQLKIKLDDLQGIIDKCVHFGFEWPQIQSRLEEINDQVWDLRAYLAWKRDYPDRDFQQEVPDPDERLLLIAKVNIVEMDKVYPLFELRTDDDIFTAQLEFMETDGVEVLPKAQRVYPYGTAAAQTIGWVGSATQQQDKELFADDRLASYLSGEICGREDGVEYVCETVLRGRRGERIYDIDNQLISRTDTQYGKDVSLTLDIKLQQRIENYLAIYKHDPNCGPGMSAVVIDIGTSDILALVSLPVFDLNRVRPDYDTLVSDLDKPMINRAINQRYPPGSVIKPLILIAGLETGHITTEEVIGCPAKDVPKPTCLQFTRFHSCHDWKWENSGGNKARNALKGSCNIYFSRLADRIEPMNLQQWLFEFGYGQDVLFLPKWIAESADTELARNFRQLSGTISSRIPSDAILRFEDVPPLRERDRRWFGIGQGNLRVTPLQVANAMAVIARDGVYKLPRLFLDSQELSIGYQASSIDLGISPETLDVIYDGMSAVVNEDGGTAYTAFEPILTTLAEQDVKIYGKTGSTQAPEHAWFAGFAKDSTNRSISIAVIVEGGQHGSSDAAPLARDIIQLCIEEDYIGKSILTSE